MRLFLLLLICLASNVLAGEKSVIGKKGMVVSEQHLATEVGANILAAGGNAIDAAVAVGYALAVVHPSSGNLGGGGFMLLRTAKGKNIFINFREKAPLAAKKDMFLDAKGDVIKDLSLKGYLAVAVPGTVLGLETVLKKYGTMTRQQVMAPAIRLAEKGFVLVPGDMHYLSAATQSFREQPNVANIFLKKDGQPYKAGDKLVQSDLANTLKLISQAGANVFYKGKIAQEIVAASQKHGGILSLKDFSQYNVEELAPLSCTYNQYTVLTAAPPSSGGVTLCEILNIIESYPIKKFGYHSAKSTHYIVEAMRYAFYDRNNELGDPDFVTNPVAKLISKEYADDARQEILDVQATPSSRLHAIEKELEGMHTTHFSVIDKFGNAVSTTVSLNWYFGAEVIPGNTGFFLNNQMDDFAAKSGEANKHGLVQGSKNTIAGGKRPLSSMTPAIILKNNKILLVLGSPGGPRIITSVLETMLNVLDYGMSIQNAVNAPRYHHQWLPDTIDMEANAFSVPVTQQLVEMGYHFTPVAPWGAVESIYVRPDHTFEGANDYRRPAGSAQGVN